MTTVKTALVIGGGIAGPAVAMALRRAGIEPVVYEAYEESASGVGAMLSIAPNGIEALRILGAHEAVSAAGQPTRDMILLDGRGRRIGAAPAPRDLPPSITLWRADLHRVLRDAAKAQGIRFEHGKRLIGVDEAPDAVTARFADGTRATADVLIGADGIHSTVRKLIDPDDPGPSHVPLLNFGAVAHTTVPADPQDMYFVFGRRAFLGYWPQLDGTTAWFINLPHRNRVTTAEARRTSPEEWLRRLREAVGDEVPGRDLLPRTRPEDLIVLGTTEIMPSARRWHRGRMVLVGDAAHAPSPSSGQGASLAVESAVQLARCLRDLPDVPSAFAAYERLRRSRVEKIAARAAKTNNTKTLGPVATTFMRLLMPIATRTFLSAEKTLGPEQRYRIDWDAPVSAKAA
ncbi:FAD-dependent oxidoreductase [Actinomadura rubrobrunea]|uniref:FAD-dependent oxidoreductase n=1 Tax=Actinomadura rubrobrunea TaxID=115335 RepID=A0A9W6PWK5_9ACTN|nr:FAD-dependent monooxygenase [Actinomadura rubrobrunea]GLW64318.1 FAD-dependent oxidoreductase [Actinomadura rubrobrunea]